MLILLYHRVAAPEHDPYDLAVSPKHFAQHVEHLQALRNVVPLPEWSSGRGAARIAVTFDDGYADNALTAAPVLQEADVPATFFITSDLVDGSAGTRFWWDRLSDAVLQTTVPSLELHLGGRDLWLDTSTPRARQQALVFVHRRVKPLPPDELRSELAQVVAACGAATPEPEARAMTPDELRALADWPGAEIGAHTRTHGQLGGQSEQVQRDEVLGSVERVARMVDRQVRTFAYPFGDPVSVGDLAPRLVAEAGCALACTTVSGPARRDARARLLPRLTVQDWDGAEFARRVAAVLRSDR